MSTLKDLQRTVAKYATVKDRLQLIISTINPVEMVTPVNLNEAKLHWLKNAKKGAFINPVFHYDYANLIRESQKLPMLGNLMEDLSAIRPAFSTDVFYQEHLMDAINDAVHTLKTAKAIVVGDDFAKSEHIFAKYGKPSQAALTHAWSIINGDINTENLVLVPHDFTYEEAKLLYEIKLDADFIKDIFIWAMEQYDKPWQVEITPNCSAIDVRDKSIYGKPVIIIPSHEQVNGIKLAELIGHEIECHWRSSQNAKRLGTLKVDSELFYEGVAKYKDWNYNAIFLGETRLPLPYYIIAEDKALKGYSFAEVGKLLTELLDGDFTRAWTFTYRTFRGIANTTNAASYAFTKDRAYLEGFLYAQALIQKDQGHLMNFSTLKIETLQALDKLLGKSELESIAIQDNNIQGPALHEILRRIKASQSDK